MLLLLVCADVVEVCFVFVLCARVLLLMLVLFVSVAAV